MKKEQWLQLLRENKEEILKKGIELFELGLNWDSKDYTVRLTEKGEVGIHPAYALPYEEGETYIRVITLDTDLREMELNYCDIIGKLEQSHPLLYQVIQKRIKSIYEHNPQLDDHPLIKESLYRASLEHEAPHVIDDYVKSLSKETKQSMGYNWALEKWQECYQSLTK